MGYHGNAFINTDTVTSIIACVDPKNKKAREASLIKNCTKLHTKYSKLYKSHNSPSNISLSDAILWQLKKTQIEVEDLKEELVEDMHDYQTKEQQLTDEIIKLKEENRVLRELNIKVQEKVIDVLEPLEYKKVVERYTGYIKSANTIQKYWRKYHLTDDELDILCQETDEEPEPEPIYKKQMRELIVEEIEDIYNHVLDENEGDHDDALDTFINQGMLTYIDGKINRFWLELPPVIPYIPPPPPEVDEYLAIEDIKPPEPEPEEPEEPEEEVIRRYLLNDDGDEYYIDVNMESNRIYTDDNFDTVRGCIFNDSYCKYDESELEYPDDFIIVMKEGKRRHLYRLEDNRFEDFGWL